MGARRALCPSVSMLLAVSLLVTVCPRADSVRTHHSCTVIGGCDARQPVRAALLRPCSIAPLIQPVGEALCLRAVFGLNEALLHAPWATRSLCLVHPVTGRTETGWHALRGTLRMHPLCSDCCPARSLCSSLRMLPLCTRSMPYPPGCGLSVYCPHSDAPLLHGVISSSYARQRVRAAL